MQYRILEVVSCQANVNHGQAGASQHPFRVQFIAKGQRKIAGTEKSIETIDVQSCAATVQVPIGKVMVEVVSGVIDERQWLRIVAVVKPEMTVAALLQAAKA